MRKHAAKSANANKAASREPKLRTTRIAIEGSQNAKTGNVNITRASAITCPTTCPFRKSYCYAELGPSNIHILRITRDGGNDIVEFAKKEAAAIRGLKRNLPLRIHEYGDCPSEESARIVSAAAEDYMIRLGQIAWTYTHAYDVPREAWGEVSVLMSTHSVEAARRAMSLGYAATLVVDSFASSKAYLIANDLVGIPCPEQTNRVADCTQCRLCWQDKNCWHLDG